MKRLYILPLLLLGFSCENFNVKKTSPEAILKEELETFNWADVDRYPTFKACDTVTSKTNRQKCFETTLTSRITTYLQEQVIVVTKDVNDTLLLDFSISNTGKIDILHIKMDANTKTHIPELETLITKSMQTIPQIFPAVKRGQQVNTKFQLPLIVKVN
jgi:hypothetical protein